MKEIATLFVIGVVLYALKFVCVVAGEMVSFRSRAKKRRTK